MKTDDATSSAASTNETMNLPGSPLTELDFENLTGSWITRELAQQALMRRVCSMDGAAVVGRNGSANYAGIAFPYVLPGAAGIREYRLRLDQPPLELRGEGSTKEMHKYLSPPG